MWDHPSAPTRHCQLDLGLSSLAASSSLPKTVVRTDPVLCSRDHLSSLLLWGWGGRRRLDGLQVPPRS